MRKLTTADILDMRAYERERDDFRQHIIAMKKRRRVALGPIMTIVFENTDTMRWQVQEMARAERLLRDEQIEHEIATYNELIPDERELSCTLLLELQDDEALREWLPKLVGVEASISFALSDHTTVVGKLSDEDAARLTRENITAAVHFLKFAFTPEQVEAFAAGPVRMCVSHSEYQQEIELTDEVRAELTGDLRAR